MVGEHVVVERGVASAPQTAVAVLALAVNRVAQALREQAPLHREVAVCVERCALVGRPRHGAVVEDQVLVVAAPDGVVLILGDIAHAETHVADDDVVGLHLHGVVAQADAVARGGLSGDGQVVVLDLERLRQADRAADVEDDNACTRLADGVAQCTGRTVVVELGHVVDLAAAAARDVHAAALGAGEGADHAVVLSGKGQPDIHTRLGIGIRVGVVTAVLGRHLDEFREVGILPFVRPDGGRRTHADPIEEALLDLEIVRALARGGRLERRLGAVAVKFVGKAHVGDIFGDAPTHIGRQVVDRHGDRRHGERPGSVVLRLLGGVAAACRQAEQHTQRKAGNATIHNLSLFIWIVR